MSRKRELDLSEETKVKTFFEKKDVIVHRNVLTKWKQVESGIQCRS